MVTHHQQVYRLAAIDGPRSAAIKLDKAALTRRDFRLARGGIGGLYETSEMEVGVQVIRNGGLAAGGGGGVNICEEVCGFEELGALQWRFFYKR
jgi:hypothetical protein